MSVSVDPASAGFLVGLGPQRFLDAVTGVDVLLPNEDEARLLAGLPEPTGVARAAAELSRRVPLVVVTRGAAGALIAERGRITAEVEAEPPWPWIPRVPGMPSPAASSRPGWRARTRRRPPAPGAGPRRWR